MKKGNKTWFEESGIPASQVTELDWWDHITLPTQPGSDQELKFVCTPAQHKSGACPFLSSVFSGSGTDEQCQKCALGRGFMDSWTTLWASWVVEKPFPSTTGADRASVYFAG